MKIFCCEHIPFREFSDHSVKISYREFSDPGVKILYRGFPDLNVSLDCRKNYSPCVCGAYDVHSF